MRTQITDYIPRYEDAQIRYMHHHAPTQVHTHTHAHTRTHTHASTLLFVLAILLVQKLGLVSSCVYNLCVLLELAFCKFCSKPLGLKECASVAHGPFGCHLKDKCVLRGEEHLGISLAQHPNMAAVGIFWS